MGKCKLFDFWTWKRVLPKPFDAIDTKYPDARSKYSPRRLHPRCMRPLCQPFWPIWRWTMKTIWQVGYR